MANYLLRSLVKGKRWICIGLIFVGLGGLFSLAANRVVDKFIPVYIGLMADQFKVKVFFKTAYYAFPCRIILEGVRITDIQAIPKAMVEVPRVTLKMAFQLFSPRDKIHITRIKLDDMAVRVPALTSPIVFNADLAFENGQFSGKLRDNRSFLQFWGHWQDNKLNWKGFMFYDGPLEKDALYILDMDGRLEIKKEGVFLEKLSFSVNGDKISAAGHFLWGAPPKFSIHAQEDLRNTKMNAYGQLGPKGILANGGMGFDLFSMEFKGLRAQVINGELLRLKVKQVRGVLRAYGSEYKISFENFLASLKRGKSAELKVALSAQLYGGRYQGQVLVDLSSQPWRVRSRGTLDQLDLDRLSEVSDHFNKRRGHLSGTLDIQAPKDMSLSAVVFMHEEDFTDLKWLPPAVSEALQMPSLEHLSATDLSFRLKVDAQAADVQDFRLRSNDLDLHGSFRVDLNDLVSSKISVLFSRKMLNESPVGQRMIRLIPQAWSMPFEFRLSGDLNRMNVQWEDSLLKRQVQRRLPDFIESIIERRANASVIPRYN